MGNFSFVWVKPRIWVPISHSFVSSSLRCGLGGLPFETSGRLTFICGTTARTSWPLIFVRTVCMHSGQLHNLRCTRKLLPVAAALELHLGLSGRVEWPSPLDKRSHCILTMHEIPCVASYGKRNAGQLLPSLVETVGNTSTSRVHTRRQVPAQTNSDWGFQSGILCLRRTSSQI